MMEKRIAELDIKQALLVLWKNKILVAAVSVLTAAVSFVWSAFLLTPQYKADILIYINNNPIAENNTQQSVSYAEVELAREMVNSYIVALNSRSCLDLIIEKADLPYSRKQLENMISAEAVGKTEWFTVTVKSSVRGEAQKIADTIAVALPETISKTMKNSTAYVADFAINPETSVTNSTVYYVASGFGLGFLLVAFVLLLLESFNDKIRNAEDLSGLYDNIPLLAVISNKAKSGYKRAYAYNEKTSGNAENRNFAFAEAYKLLQTHIEYSIESKQCKIIGFVSTDKNKSSKANALNSAISLADCGKKVLLIEADMRLPYLAKKLLLTSTPGLSEYLTGKADVNQVIQNYATANLSVICAGTLPPNPATLLGGNSMPALLAVCGNDFDYIILDLPPVNTVSDALVTAKYIDGFVISVTNGFSTRKAIQSTAEKFAVTSANIIGFTLNENI